jgi:HB1, ASXL, restriction endonuclease HTH domain
MKIREQHQKLLDRKQQEIQDLKMQIEKAKAYIQALQDTMRFLPKEENQEDASLRPGTALAQTREVLRKAGRPMHVNDILKALNKPIDKKHRVSLSGSLSTYVRNGQIFTRPAPNTFGLFETTRNSSHGTDQSEEELDIPDEFGADN